jgi:ATP-dependent DNA helicase RecQ
MFRTRGRQPIDALEHMGINGTDSEGWPRARLTVLARDEYRCRDCGSREEARDLDVHHLIPRAAGGGDKASNLVTLCDGCHAARHPNLQVSLARGAIEGLALRLCRWFDRKDELPDEIAALSAALRLFGKERLRDGQLEAVLTAMRGESMLVVRPTGSGKTLCFQLPAILREGTTVVLSPLKALMKDQVAELHELKLPGTFINGDLSRTEKAGRYELLQGGAFKFLYVTPERFDGDRAYSQAEVEQLSGLRPSFLVVDEAHCVDRWGADFRPAYDRIAEIRAKLGNPPILAFTATAGREAQDRIVRSMGVPDAKRLVTGVDRPNIALVRHRMPGGRNVQAVRLRANLIVKLVQTLEAGKAMIFVPTIKIGEALEQAIAAAGLSFPFYHANLGTPNDREMIVQRFTGRQNPPLRAVICTSAFGMGMDVPDVRLVINWQHPASVEDYLQEFGRAGRDGKPALAVLFSDGGREAELLEWMAEKTADAAPDHERAQNALSSKKQAINNLAGLVADNKSCFREGLLAYLIGSAVAPTSKASFARRIADWLFSERTRVRDAPFCCDFCHPEKTLLALEGHF